MLQRVTKSFSLAAVTFTGAISFLTSPPTLPAADLKPSKPAGTGPRPTLYTIDWIQNELGLKRGGIY